MTARFVTTLASTERQDDGVITGAAAVDPSIYLTFQRSLPIGDDDDCGVYVEFAGQVNSGHDKVRRCSLQREVLRVDLIEPIDQHGHEAVEVDLRVSDEGWESLAAGLRLVFTGREVMLSVEDGEP